MHFEDDQGCARYYCGDHGGGMPYGCKRCAQFLDDDLEPARGNAESEAEWLAAQRALDWVLVMTTRAERPALPAFAGGAMGASPARGSLWLFRSIEERDAFSARMGPPPINGSFPTHRESG